MSKYWQVEATLMECIRSLQIEAESQEKAIEIFSKEFNCNEYWRIECREIKKSEYTGEKYVYAGYDYLP